MKYFSLAIILIIVILGSLIIFLNKDYPFPAPLIIIPPKETPPDETPEETPAEITMGNQNKRQVIFTFDAGAGANSLPQILDVLDQHNIKGTFFLTGIWAETNPLLTKEISDRGNEIFNHTYSHPHLTQLTDDQIAEELRKAEEIINNITDKTTKGYFRPPFGERNQRVLDAAWENGYRSVYWTIDVLDWKEPEGFTAQQAKERIFNNLQPGTIYLMHVGDNITGQILNDVFTEIQNQEYSIVSLTEGIK